MKSRLRVASIVVLLLVVGGLLARLLATISRTETGAETVSRQWRDATIGLVAGKTVPVAERRPEEQADYWLAETERIAREHPNDAEVMMGAALVLHQSAPPGQQKVQDSEGSVARELGVAAFDARCKNACLDFAARATQLDPGNADWWRLRALLLRNACDDGWRDVFAECRQNDPDNSLYDYLAAVIYWEASTYHDSFGSDDWLVIQDVDRFRLGIESLERGLTKREFAAPDDVRKSLFAFLSHTNLSLLDQEQVVRYCHAWHSPELSDMLQTQRYRAIEHAAADNVAAAMPVLRQNLQIVEQYTRPGFAREFAPSAFLSKGSTAEAMLTLIDKYGFVATEEERRRIESLRLRASVQFKLYQHAHARQQSSMPDSTLLPGGIRWSPEINVVVEWLPKALLSLLAAGAVLIGVSKLFGVSKARKVTAVWQAMALVAALAITIVACSLAPLEVISRDLQEWSLSILILSPPFLLMAIIVIRGLKRRRFRISLRFVVVGMLILSMFFGVVSIARRRPYDLPSFPFELSLIKIDRGPYFFSQPKIGLLDTLEQWHEYYGHLATIALWAAIVTVVYVVKTRRAPRNDSAIRWREAVGNWMRMTGRASAALAVFLLIAYLALAPWNVRFVEHDFQQYIAYVRRPNEQRAEFEKLIRSFEADKQFMRQLAAEFEVNENQ